MTDDFFPASDDLSQVISAAPRQGLPQDPQLARIRDQQTGVVEPCPKCRGTGRFVGYTGRLLGPCFACKGAGKKTFANTAPVRAANRQKAADRKARQQAS